MLTTGNVENFAEYSQFKNLKEFNVHIEMFLSVHKKSFTKTEYMIFRRLTKYAAKIAGVATTSIKTVLEGVKQKDFALGASESTFQRMKRKAINLGILEAKPRERMNGSQSSNLWVFKRFTTDTPRTQDEQAKAAPVKEKVVTQLTPLKASTSSFKASNKKNINNQLNVTEPFVKATPIKSFFKGVPAVLNRTYANIFDNLDSIYKRICWATKAFVKEANTDVSKDEKVALAVVTMRAIASYKREGATNEDLCRLAYSIMYKQLTEKFAVKKQPRQNIYVDDRSVSKEKATRTEIVPAWFDESNKEREAKHGTKQAVTDEQKAAIWAQVRALQGAK